MKREASLDRRGRFQQVATRLVAATLAAMFVCGCGQPWTAFYQQPVARPLGALSDPVWQAQERGAEMADFVIYQHEFKPNAVRLNTAGEDHVKQIAARLLSGQDAMVVVERSWTTAKSDTEYHYPVHTNPELDLERREVVVMALNAMGIADAEERVLVAPEFTTGFEGSEAEAAYQRGIGTTGIGGGFGGFFFGGGAFF